MNARQRRQDRKLWRYSVETVARDWDHYSEMWHWLKAKHTAKVTRCGWRDRIDRRNNSEPENYPVTWQFIHERDAIEFALRWA